jgi:hypothetical protein
LIPAPDIEASNSKRRSADVVDSLVGHVAAIHAAVGDHPGLGANRAAEMLAERTGIAGVARFDVEALAEQGLLRIVDYYKEWPLYSTDDLRGFEAVEVLQAPRRRARRVVGGQPRSVGRGTRAGMAQA